MYLWGLQNGVKLPIPTSDQYSWLLLHHLFKRENST